MRQGVRHLRRLLVALLAVPVALVALASFSPWSEASVGVGVQVGPVSLGSVAHPGASYALPPVYVVNTGTQAEAISVRVERLTRGPGRVVPPSWIQFTGPDVQLAPGQAARLPLELVVPSLAKPGRYMSDIVVTGSAVGSSGTADLGVAAAAKLEFQISPIPAQGLSPSFPLWTWWVITGLLLLAFAVFGVRRSGLRIRVERNNAHRGATDRLGGPRA